MTKIREGYKETEIGIIPEDWEISKLNNIGSFRKGKGIKKDEVVDTGIQCIRYGQIYTDYNHVVVKTKSFISEEIANSSMKIDKGELILAGSGETLEDIGKAVAYLGDEPCYVGGDTIIFRPSLALNSLYLSYFLATKKVTTQKRKLGQGNSIVHLYVDGAKQIQVYVPPLPEQKRIAEILSTTDAHIEKLDKTIEDYQLLKKGMMKKLLTEGINHTEFKETEIGRIPKEWEATRIIDLADKSDRYSFTGGPFGSDLKSSDYTLEGIRVIQLQNIGDGNFLNDSKIYTSTEKANELINSNIYPNDLILAKMAAPVARACKIPDFYDRYVMCSDGIRLKVNPLSYDSSYCLYSINSHYFRKQAEANSTGTTRLRIGLTALKELKIAIPPLVEQQQISQILIMLDDRIDLLINERLDYIQLKKSLMEKLLTGKVRAI